MTPKYQHDCQQCEFLGHFFDHDVYVCSNLSRSVIARYGMDDEYISYPAKIFLALIEQDRSVIEWSTVSMTATDSQAMLMGLAVKALRESTKSI